ncbi:MAG: GNAT family N-acetyltransferase [Oceanospirillaceae bacterium]
MINELKIEISKVTAADLAIVEPLFYACDAYHYQQLAGEFKTPEKIASQRTPQSFTNLLSSGNYVMFIAKINQQPCGVIAGKIIDQESFIHSSKKIGYIDEISVLPSFQGRGIAQKLVDSIEDYFQTFDIDEVMLSVYQFNSAAMGLYDKLGYSSKLTKMSKSIR